MSADPDLYLTKEDFDAYRRDPMRLVLRASELMNAATARIDQQRERNRAIEDLKNEITRVPFSDGGYLQITREFDSLQKEFTDLETRAKELSSVNETLEEIATSLEIDKDTLTDHVAVLRMQKASKSTDHTRLAAAEEECNHLKQQKEAQLAEQDCEIAARHTRCTELSAKVLEMSDEVARLQRSVDNACTAKIPHDTELATLQQTANMQAATIDFLSRELEARNEQLESTKQSFETMKRDMRSKIETVEGETARLRAERDEVLGEAAHENALTEQRNQAAVENLKEHIAHLIVARRSFTDEVAATRHDDLLKREKLSRLQANVDVLAQRRTLLEADVRRVRQQLEAMRATFSKRAETIDSELRAVMSTAVDLHREVDSLRSSLRTARHAAPAGTSQSILKAINALLEQLDAVVHRAAERTGEPTMLAVLSRDSARSGANDSTAYRGRGGAAVIAATPTR